MQIIQRERANVGNYSSQVQFAVTFAGFCSVHDCKERFIQNLVKQADKTVHNYVKTREDMLYSHISIIGRSNGISDLNRVHLMQTQIARVRAEGSFILEAG